jgi:hypothetical protein
MRIGRALVHVLVCVGVLAGVGWAAQADEMAKLSPAGKIKCPASAPNCWNYDALVLCTAFTEAEKRSGMTSHTSIGHPTCQIPLEGGSLTCSDSSIRLSC